VLVPCPLLTAISYGIEAFLTPEGFTLHPHELCVVSAPGAAFRADLQALPRDGAGVLGAVVVCLPSAFEGGELQVHPPKSTVKASR